MTGKFSRQLVALLAMLLLGTILAGCYLGQKGRLYLPPPETKQSEQQQSEQQQSEQQQSEQQQSGQQQSGQKKSESKSN